MRLPWLALLLVSAPVLAQSDFPVFPLRPVRIIVNFATGGPSDIVARIVSAKLTGLWGKPVVVENIAGGGGNIGVERAIKATPDGYTVLLSGSSPLVINPSLVAKPAFDTVRDLAPITLLCTVPNLLIINPAVPAKTVEEFVALAKAKPGQYTFASSGAGTATHLGGELFKARAGIDLRHIPYKGTGAMLPDLVSGRVTLTVAAVATFLSLVRDGRLRAIAVASGKRTAALPDVPTVAEAGYAGVDTSSWQGVWAPARTPAPITRRLNQDLAKVVALPDARARFTELGMEPLGNSEQQFARVIDTDLRKWARVIKDAGLVVER